MSYVQSSTDNPYGHTPWQTAIYSGFEKYAWLKQPQNEIVREPASIKPQIYKPPELERKTLGDVVIITGAGRRVPLRRGLGIMYAVQDGAPIAVNTLPLRTVVSGGSAMPVPPPPTPPILLPPSSVPPPPQVFYAGGQTIVYTPGQPGVIGTPFPPPAPGVIPGSPSTVLATPTVASPVTPAVSAAAAPPATDFISSVTAWLQGSTVISGLSNYWIAIAAVGVGAFLWKRRR